MLGSKDFTNQINSISLSNYLRKDGYAELFYSHLTKMMKFPLLSGNQAISTMPLTKRTYLGLEEFILGNTTIVESDAPTNDIDWDSIDDLKDELKNKLNQSLGKEANADTLKPMVKFMTNLYENFMIYDNMHHHSEFNPWLATNEILLDNGYLILVSDDKDLVKDYDKKILDKIKEDSSELFVVAASKKEKSFSGFPIDIRNISQGLVYDYLKREAFGTANAKSIKDIMNYLASKGQKYSELAIKNKILLPLKREALIGSTTQGYFYINSNDDFIVSYHHHQEKLRGIKKTLKMYELQAKKRGIELPVYNY